MDYASMNITEIGKLPGVEDIKPFLARGKFAMALKTEAQGDHEKALKLLDEAIAVVQ